MRKFHSIWILAALLIATGCCVHGSGNIETENRDIESFDKIRIEVSAEVVISEGAADTIEVKTDDNLLKHIQTRVVDGTLLIKSDIDNCLDTTLLEIRVSTAELSDLKIDGDADVTLDGEFAAEEIVFSIDGSGSITADGALNADVLKIGVDGSGDVKLLELDVNEINTSIDGSADILLAGTAPLHSIDIDGSAEISAYDLETETTNISIDGSGTCKVNATGRLSVSIDGSGSVYYLGTPEVSRSIEGSGTVQSVD